MNIVCVLKSGGIYDKNWVNRLSRNVKDFVNFKFDYKFICLSDLDLDYVDCERISLVHNWPGWWSKIEIFRKGLFKGRVLFLDLDVLITGDLEPILLRKENMICMKDNLYKGINSSVMCFNDNENEIYEKFILNDKEIMKKYRSDQDWINELKPDLPNFNQDLISSFKYQCKEGLPKDTRIVVCHGRPKPNEVREKWFVKIYDKYTQAGEVKING